MEVSTREEEEDVVGESKLGVMESLGRRKGKSEGQRGVF
jgi:hypothetical protein